MLPTLTRDFQRSTHILYCKGLWSSQLSGSLSVHTGVSSGMVPCLFHSSVPFEKTTPGGENITRMHATGKIVYFMSISRRKMLSAMAKGLHKRCPPWILTHPCASWGQRQKGAFCQGTKNEDLSALKFKWPSQQEVQRDLFDWNEFIIRLSSKIRKESTQ